MRRKIILSFFLALCGVSVSAQEYNLNFGACFSMYDRGFVGHSEIIAVERTKVFNGVEYRKSPVVLPTFSLEWGYIFPKNQIGAFLGAYWNHAWTYLNGGPSPMRESESIIHLVPQLRLYYYYVGGSRLYATIGLGARFRVFSETFEGDTIRGVTTTFSYLISPFGMSFGDKWTLACDFGYGSPWSVISITAGYRF